MGTKALEYDVIESVTRTGINTYQEKFNYSKRFMANDLACYDSHLLKKANMLQRLKAKHALKYGKRNEGGNDR